MSAQIMDCTIRDGGLMNRWDFSIEEVRNVYWALADAGVDYMEIGYKASTSVFDPSEFGPWRFCLEEDIRKVTGDHPRLKISVMADIGRCNYEDILPAEKSVIHTIRVACYLHQLKEAVELAAHCKEKGYETFINIMAVSEHSEKDLVNGLKKLNREADCDGIYLVDSYGSFSMKEIAGLARLYKSCLPGRILGFHGHNNQQLALANTLTAMEEGITLLDSSIYGMGRAAGNTPTELLLPRIKGDKGSIEPLLPIIHSVLEPRTELLKWGYRLPYALTGIHNIHPRPALECVETGQTYSEFNRELNLSNP